MFEGIQAIFTGGISNARISIFTNILIKNNGNVIKRIKTASLFKKMKKITSLDENLTHIIVENRNLTYAELCHQLDCHEIPNHIKIIHCSWIEQCAKNKCLLDPIEYEVNLSMNEEKNTTEEKSEIPNLKRDISDDSEGQNSSKYSRRSDIEVLNISGQSYGEECHDMGNGWHLLHNIIDGQRIPSLLFRFSEQSRICSRIVGFDMDGTLISTKSGWCTPVTYNIVRCNFCER